LIGRSQFFCWASPPTLILFAPFLLIVALWFPSGAVLARFFPQFRLPLWHFSLRIDLFFLFFSLNLLSLKTVPPTLFFPNVFLFFFTPPLFPRKNPFPCLTALLEIACSAFVQTPCSFLRLLHRSRCLRFHFPPVPKLFFFPPLFLVHGMIFRLDDFSFIQNPFLPFLKGTLPLLISSLDPTP